MATGGWGYTPNPFANAAAPAPAETEEQQQPPRAQNAYGAWGGGMGVATPSSSPSPVPTAPPAIANAFNVAGGAAAAAPGGVAQREAELARREADIARREAAMAQLAESVRPANFPPFCPFIYHSISEQIPSWNRSMVRFHFVTELLVALGFIYNAVIILAAMFAGIVGLTWWLFSLIALSLGLPLSWWMYYKSLFRAAQTDGATYPYIRSGLCTLINIAWCVWMVLGLSGLGEFSGGIFQLIKLFQRGDSKSVAFGIMYIVNVVIWGLAGIGGWLSLAASIAAYRRGDGPRRDYEARYGAASAAA
ncbi:MAG: scamp family-domain-containing protein [Monoraphidium minutum]|nr:MAG: scamp family-domain-containing protein [Monoraphidium minutum]